MLELPPALVDRGRLTAIPVPVTRPAGPEPLVDPTALLASAAELARRVAPASPDTQAVREALESLAPVDGWSLLEAMTLGFTGVVPDGGVPADAVVRTPTGWRFVGASRCRHPDEVQAGWWPGGAHLLASLAPELVTENDVAASLDVVETELAALPDDAEFAGVGWQGWAATWRALARAGVEMAPDDAGRWFGLERWVYERVPPGRVGSDLWDSAVVARRVGACTLEDLWWVVARAPGFVRFLTRPSGTRFRHPPCSPSCRRRRAPSSTGSSTPRSSEGSRRRPARRSAGRRLRPGRSRPPPPRWPHPACA